MSSVWQDLASWDREGEQDRWAPGLGERARSIEAIYWLAWMFLRARVVLVI